MSGDLCGASCSDKSCCDSFAKCVVCCHADLQSGLRADLQSGLRGDGGDGGGGLARANRELPPVSPMHPSMWRKWLMTHNGDGGGGGDVRGESFGGSNGGGNDEYRVSPFDYCKHRCRSNSAVTKNENEFQDPRHHCFGGTYVEKIGAQETLSPG